MASSCITGNRVTAVMLDPESISHTSADIVQERAIAIWDLLEDNHFEVPNHNGPYHLHLSLIDNRLAFTIQDEQQRPLMTHFLSLSPLRRLVRDYFLICENYYSAIRDSSPSHIEAIDMGRRGLHNEGAQLVLERFEGKVNMDFPTARRLFTLIAALHWKG
jgi:uncharacterized protein (UPF0262 family)